MSNAYKCDYCSKYINGNPAAIIHCTVTTYKPLVGEKVIKADLCESCREEGVKAIKDLLSGTVINDTRDLYAPTS